MKLLSVVIPCYNSQDYMSRCIDSVLAGGKSVEILIVDDGSTDRTAEIADAYALRFPEIVRVIHQKNGGHGEAVNTGLKYATGLYFKVVDSDDRLGKGAYFKVLQTLKAHADPSSQIDLLLTNFVYDKEGAKRKKIMHYRASVPVERLCGWDDIGRIKRGKYLLMHALTFRTQILRDSGLKLPAHTFYVDNYYAYRPLPFVEKIYYLDVNLYYYYIGREDQSVHEDVMISRIDQQLRVNRLMLDYYTEQYDRFRHSKRLKQYMYSYLEVITVISCALLARSGKEENYRKIKALWKEIRRKNKKLYYHMHYLSIAGITCMPGKIGRSLVSFGYRVAHRIYKFN